VAAVADEDQESAAWSDLRERIGVYMETVFILSIARDKEIWQFIVGRAAHLEYLAVVSCGLPPGNLDLGRSLKTI
jgi:hypothetical protein